MANKKHRCEFKNDLFKKFDTWRGDKTDQCWLYETKLYGDHYYCSFHVQDMGVVPDKDIDKLQSETLETLLDNWNSEQENEKTAFVLPKIKCGYINLKQYTIKSKLYLPEARFSGHVNFSSAQFDSDIDFQSAYFCGTVSFNSTSFSGNINFAYATFLKVVSFNNSNFSGNINFPKTKFKEATFFTSAEFSGVVNFLSSDFSMGARFNSAIFDSKAKFNCVKFNGNASFECAVFKEPANFYSTIFNESAIFDRAKFCGEAIFDSSEFRGCANFSSIIFDDNADFDKTKFRYGPDMNSSVFGKAPIFHNVSFTQDVNFRDVLFKNVKDYDSASCYRTLKLEMSKISNRRQEAKFYALEQRSLRHQPDTPKGYKAISLLYEICSDYGQSFQRPFWGLLLGVIPLFALLYGAIKYPIKKLPEFIELGWPSFSEKFFLLLEFSVTTITAPFKVWSYKYGDELLVKYFGNDLVANWGFGLKVFASFQSLIGITLITLFILAIRRAYKLN